MDFSVWIACFFPLFIVFFMGRENKRKKKQRCIINKIKINRKKGSDTMNEAIKSFIGKECIITTINDNVIGVMESVEDNWIIVRSTNKNGSKEIVNVDYVSCIQEYPRNKKERKNLS